MKHNRILALVAAVFVTALSLGTAEVCHGQTNDEYQAALELLLTSTNKQLPMDYGNGQVNTKLVREGKYVVYYYLCDEPRYNLDRMNRNIHLLTETILKEVNSDEFFISYLRKTCKNAGVGIGYCYIGKESGKTARVYIPVEKLK